MIGAVAGLAILVALLALQSASFIPLSTTTGPAASYSQSTPSTISTTVYSVPIHYLNCTVNLSGLPSYQNQTSTIDLLSRNGFSPNSTAYRIIGPLNITKIDVMMTQQPAFQQTIVEYVWTRAGWGPYLNVTLNSQWSAYFPYSYPPSHAQDFVTPRDVYFWYEVYTLGGVPMGSFIGAYDIRYGNSSFSVFTPHVQCPIAP